MDFRKVIVLVLGLGVLFWVGSAGALTGGGNFFDNVAGVFFKERISQEEIQKQYYSGELKVLIVPGHTAESPGAVYRNIREFDLNVDLANRIANILKEEEDLTVFVTRDVSGQQMLWFQEFLKSGREHILAFREEVRKTFREAREAGDISDYGGGVNHNYASSAASFELYGVNAYANMNNFDIVLHVHFNDHANRPKNNIGKHYGFSVYVPENELPNSEASQILGKNLMERLNRYIAKSSLPQETEGLVMSQDLIAVGSNASRDGASVLVEYGYIYEPQLRNAEVQNLFLDELAYQTYLGIMDHLLPEEGNTVFVGNVMGSRSYKPTATLPYQWREDLQTNDFGLGDVFALQLALREEGLYPPEDKKLSECPINGNFGPCTKLGVSLFQEKYKSEILEPAGLNFPTGYFGSLSMRKLNKLYGDVGKN